MSIEGKRARQGFLRIAQTSAETLLIKAAQPRRREGSTTSMAGLRAESRLFPIRSYNAIGKFLSAGISCCV